MKKSKTKEIEIKVTKNHIAKGLAEDNGGCCMVDRAIGAVCRKNVTVNTGSFVISLYDGAMEFTSRQLPKSVQSKIELHDQIREGMATKEERKALKPFSFKTRLPVDALKPSILL